ncbi:hypothetical protein O181_025079 [Austropuccinia psidii MF-1]|uniref:Reverse transcriptase Ty1/copia-type domain-containing protein n=1 Tax=Austropuccinia psidii MF-1 TaxID=1389203 RepID=A0A9Q3H0A3_9BASI|nr:hypothetical protein [Austropuccinia psidii MF-1]
MENGISLYQQHFTEALLEQYGMDACKAMLTPLTPNKNLRLATDNEMVAFKNLKMNFRSSIGSINYLSTASRADILFAVSTLSQYLEQPGIKHLQALLHFLKYLRGSSVDKNNGITAFSNTDWGNCRVTWQSTTGYLSHFHNCLILWKKQKQPSVSISTEEAKYKIVCNLTFKLLLLRQWCEEAKLFAFTEPIHIFEDNQSCI